MGCAGSREEPDHRRPRPRRQSSSSSASPTPSSSFLRNQESSISLPSMGGPGNSRLASQHERLILELLPFKDAGKFQEWLQSGYVRGSWNEFCRDFLDNNPGTPEPDKEKTAKEAKDAIDSKSTKYLVFHPDKTGWTAEDHHVRFIATVISDNILNKLWSWHDWKKKDIQIAKAVYEVLSFLRTTQHDPMSPPGYHD